MTHTLQPTDERGPTPPGQRPWWRTPWPVVAMVVLAFAAIVVAVFLRPDNGSVVEPAASSTAAPTTEAIETTAATTTPTTVPPTTSAIEPVTLTWAKATESPRGQVLAVTATDAGYLAASHTTDGVEVWVSDGGDAWTMLAADPEAFRPNYRVYVLRSGPAGFVAEAFDPAAEVEMGTNSVFASTDGATWYRTELTGNLPEIGSPYVVQHSVVHGVLIGPDGFLAVGSGSLMPDFDLIAAEFAPGYSSKDVWAVDAEMRPEGAVLIIGFGEDEPPMEIPFGELGIEAEDLGAIFEEEGEEPAISQFLWWSADGATWEQITPQGLPESWLIWFVTGSVGADDGFYVFTADPDTEDPEGPAVIGGYHSIDGRVWTPFEFEGPAGYWMDTVNYGEGLFVAVGEDEAGRALWTSTDARVWRRAPGSEAVFDLGYEGDYSIEEIDIGGAGFVAIGHVWDEEEMYPTVPVEPVIVKEGYAVAFAEDGQITITDQATGEVEAFEMETGRSATLEVLVDEVGLTFVEIASGETLLVVTNQEYAEAWNELAEGLGGMGQPPPQVLRYSTDLATWTLEPAEEIFGEGTFAVSGDMDGDTVVAVAASDLEGWNEEPDRLNLPPTVIWVGTPGG